MTPIKGFNSLGMKRVVRDTCLTLYMFVCCFFSVAQEVYMLPDSLLVDETMIFLTEYENGNFLLLKQSGQPANSYYEALQNRESTIILTNSSMQEINSTVISSGNERTKILAEGILQVDGQILLHGNALDTVSMDTKLCLIWLDLDLNITHLKYYGVDNEEEIFMSYCVNHQCNYVFAGEYPIFSQNQKLVFIEVDCNGKMINSCHTDQLIWHPDIVFLENDQSYAVGDKQYIFKYGIDYNQISITQPELYQYFFPWGLPVKINDSLYFRAGTAMGSVYPPSWEISRVIFNTDAEYSDEYQIVIPDVADIPADKSAISFVDQSSDIYFGGTSNGDEVPFESKVTKFALQKFNLGGTFHWVNLYKTVGNARMVQVLALQDGGCLMAGQIYDWRNSPVQQRDLFFIKVDDMGIVTGIEEDETSPAKITVYPNPGTNQLNLSVDDEVLKFTMYDFNGRKVWGDMHPSKTIDVSKLNPGFYIWWAELKDGTTSWGKWIKQ
ncbi:MAG: hypothetical protein B6I19_02980 [Bacteroidetes bacterium 4572_114]|nr:MAG: hypothetical protein B6I19_02980 [Bacteroidetes bacterium 4572_114]